MTGSGVKNPPADAEATGYEGSIPGSGRVPGGGSGNPLQYSGLENPTEPAGKPHTQTHTHTHPWTEEPAGLQTTGYVCAIYRRSQMREA